jgi:hypothetical protein
MAFDQVGVVNIALFNIKQKKIASMSEASVAAETASAVYEYILKEVLERHSWKFALITEELTKDETYVSTGEWDYQYNKPTVECLRIEKVRDENNIDIPYEDEGDYIHSDHDNDLGDAIAEDDMSADGTTDWTDDGANISLLFDTDHYEVTTDAVNKNAWLASKSVEKNRSYVVSITLKDGTATGKQVELYFYDGAAQYSEAFTSSGIETPISATFKCANTTDSARLGIRVVDSLASSNLELKDFTVYDGGEDPLYMKFVTYEDDPTKWTAAFVKAFSFDLSAAMAAKLAPDMQNEMLEKYELYLNAAIAHDQSKNYIKDDKGNTDLLDAGRT